VTRYDERHVRALRFRIGSNRSHSSCVVFGFRFHERFTGTTVGVGRKLRVRVRIGRGLWSLPNRRDGAGPIRSGYKDRHASRIPPASNPVRILASS
jgi:hypothetical protein